MRLCYFCLLHALLLLAAAPAGFAQPRPPGDLETALMQLRLPLQLSGGKLQGSGGDLLRREIERSRFVLLGERISPTRCLSLPLPSAALCSQTPML